MYGSGFEKAYIKYKGDKKKGTKGDRKLRWYEPPNGICIKSDESNPYCSLPLFTGLITSVFDIEDYKMLQKAKKENDNYKALCIQLPTDNEGIPILDYDKSEMYYNHISNNINNDGIGLFMSPFNIKDFSFASTANSEKNESIEAEEEFWMSSGTSSLLFGSAKATSSSSLLLSVKPDEQIAFSMLLQLQRFLNKKIKQMNLKYGFKCEFTSQSIFNNNEYVDRYAKAAQFGVCSKISYAASLGYTPCDISGLTYLEEDILGLGTKKWIHPLVSSSVQSGVPNEGGRPTSEESGNQIGDAGEATRNNDSNTNR